MSFMLHTLFKTFRIPMIEETVVFFSKNAWHVKLRQFFSLEFKNFFHPINFKNILKVLELFFNQMIKNRTKQNDELNL